MLCRIKVLFYRSRHFQCYTIHLTSICFHFLVFSNIFLTFSYFLKLYIDNISSYFPNIISHLCISSLSSSITALYPCIRFLHDSLLGGLAATPAVYKAPPVLPGEPAQPGALVCPVPVLAIANGSTITVDIVQSTAVATAGAMGPISRPPVDPGSRSVYGTRACALA